MILAKQKEIELTLEQKEKMYWDNWVFDSHKWVEFHQGYYTCEFCKNIHTSVMPTNAHGFCTKNPIIMENLKLK